MKPRKHAPRGPLKARSEADLLVPRRPLVPKCSAHSKRTGERCRRWAIAGGTVCIMHGGSAPHVKAAAAERLMALQHPAIDALSWLIQQKDFPSAAFAAARDVLDRTEGRPTEKVDMNVTGDAALIASLAMGRKRVADARKG